jgi:hypothetical protein
MRTLLGNGFTATAESGLVLVDFYGITTTNDEDPAIVR